VPANRLQPSLSVLVFLFPNPTVLPPFVHWVQRPSQCLDQPPPDAAAPRLDGRNIPYVQSACVYP
jgi:hypothetical protein